MNIFRLYIYIYLCTYYIHEIEFLGEILKLKIYKK